MTSPTLIRSTTRLSLSGLAAREQAAVAAGTTTACGKVCDDGCHGDVACIRAAHAHEPDAVTPHLRLGPDGAPLQWTCLPGDHDGLTPEQRATKRTADLAAARDAATRVLMAQIDPALLVSLLREGGHL